MYPALPTLLDFTQEIADLIARQSPGIWTAFNSIRFDEKMLRQAFYQTLQRDIFGKRYGVTLCGEA